MATTKKNSDQTTPSLKKPDLYEDLREEGASKEKAARISNAAAQKGRSTSSVAAKGGRSGSYDDWTVPDLRKRAKELGLSNYSGKRKSELVTMLRHH
ncbi:MAG: Rho termination factor N-terminal domain-containing protein [Aeromicrobium sp.]